MQLVIQGRTDLFPALATVQRTSQSKIIQTIALRTLAELAISFAIGLAISFFVSPAAIGYLISSIAIRCALNFALRCLQGVILQNTMEKAHFFGFVRGFNFPGMESQTLIHEGGHALSTYLVYRKPNPEITLNPGRGGATSFAVNKLSKFGKLLGPKRALAFVTAAGASLTLFVSTILLGIGLKIRRAHPETSAYLIAYAITDFTTHFYYAISALWSPMDQLSHDFVRLYILTGLHPLIAAVMIAAVPVLMITYAIHWGSRRSTGP